MVKKEHRHPPAKERPFYAYACVFMRTSTEDILRPEAMEWRWCLDDGEYYHPILFCPYCGIELKRLL